MADNDKTTGIPDRLKRLITDPAALQFLSSLDHSKDEIQAMRENGEQLIWIAHAILEMGRGRCQLAETACKQHKYPRGGYVCEICGHDCE